MGQGIENVADGKNLRLEGNFLFPKSQVSASVQALMVATGEENVGFYKLVSQENVVKLQDVSLDLFELFFGEFSRFQENFPGNEELTKVMDKASNPHCLLPLLRKTKTGSYLLGESSHPKRVMVGIGVDLLKERDKAQEEAIKNKMTVVLYPRFVKVRRKRITPQNLPDVPCNVSGEDKNEKEERTGSDIEEEHLFPLPFREKEGRIRVFPVAAFDEFPLQRF
jgi:hypothetical protein